MKRPFKQTCEIKPCWSERRGYFLYPMPSTLRTSSRVWQSLVTGTGRCYLLGIILGFAGLVHWEVDITLACINQT